MRNLAFVAAALAILGVAAPTINSANAETVVIKRHYDNGWHRGWHADMGSRRVIVERHDRGIAATIVTEENTLALGPSLRRRSGQPLIDVYRDGRPSSAP
jgi:hypothetical protein